MEFDELFCSTTEWQLMSAIWDLEVADAAAASKVLRERFGLSYTAKTTGILLARLAEKGLLRSAVTNPVGRGRPAHVYSPALSREQGIRAQFRKFLADHSITPQEAEILRSILARSF
jgi:predicted transcriptional regulator